MTTLIAEADLHGEIIDGSVLRYTAVLLLYHIWLDSSNGLYRMRCVQLFRFQVCSTRVTRLVLTALSICYEYL